MANFFDTIDPKTGQQVKAATTDGAPSGQVNFFDNIDEKTGLEKEKGFFDKVGNAFDERVGNMTDIGLAKDKQTSVETGAQQVGQILGLGTDTIGAGLSTIYDKTAAPLVKEGFHDLGQMIAESPVGDAARYVGNKYHKFEEENPRAGRNLAAAGNVIDAGLNLLPGTKTAENVAKMAISPEIDAIANGLGKAVQGGAKKVGNAFKADEILKNSQVFDEARKGYKFAEESGVQLNPQSVLNAVEKSAAEIKGKGKLTLGKPTLATEYIDHLRSAVGKDALSFDDIIGLDQEITDHLGGMFNPATGGYTAEGNQLKKLRQGLRDMMADSAENPQAHVLGGDARGVKAYQDATRLWAKAINLKKTENVIERGIRTQQPAQSLATGFKNLSLNDKKISGFSPAAKKAALAASEKGFIIDKVGALGSRLIPMVGLGGGGIPGYLAGEGVSTAARSLASRAQLKKANKVLRELSKDGRFLEPAAAPVAAAVEQPIRLLPAPAREIAVDGAGNAQEVAPAIAARQRAEQLGMTGDIRKVIGQKLSNEMKAAKNADWDKLDAATQTRVADEISQAWDGQKQSLPALIEQAQQQAKILAGEMGEPVQGTVLSEALQKAAEKAKMKQILNMPPRQGLQALKGKK